MTGFVFSFCIVCRRAPAGREDLETFSNEVAGELLPGEDVEAVLVRLRREGSEAKAIDDAASAVRLRFRAGALPLAARSSVVRRLSFACGFVLVRVRVEAIMEERPLYNDIVWIWTGCKKEEEE